MKIMVAGQQDYPEYLRMLVVGESGVNKTEFACNAPNPLFISCNTSNLPVLSTHGVRYINANSEKDLLQVKTFLTSEDVPENVWGPVETLVIDDLEELQRKLFLEKLRKEKRSDIKRDDWNWISQRMNAILSGLNEIKAHIIYLSSAKEISVDDSTYLEPALQGAFSDQIHNYVDISALLVSTSYNASVDNETLEELSEGEDSMNPEESRVLITVPSSWARWPKNTVLQPSMLDVTNTTICDIIDSMKVMRASISDSSVLFTVDTETKEEPTKEESPKEKSVTIPGMSTDEQIKDLLKQNKDKNPSTKKKKGALVYGTNA